MVMCCQYMLVLLHQPLFVSVSSPIYAAVAAFSPHGAVGRCTMRAECSCQVPAAHPRVRLFARYILTPVSSAGAPRGRAAPGEPKAAGDGPEGEARQEQHQLQRCAVLCHVPPGL